MDEKKIKLILRKFAKKRKWDQFHTLKNLAMALSVEASELVEIFQWEDTINNNKIEKKLKEKISDEVADILLYLIRFADKANINLEKACFEKIKKNEIKYPAEKFKGTSKKYNQ